MSGNVENGVARCDPSAGGAEHDVDAPSRAPSLAAALELAMAWCKQTAAVAPGVFECLLAPDCIVHGLAAGGVDLTGPGQVLSLFQQLWVLYPPKARKECRILDSIVQDDKVAIRWVMLLEPGSGDWRTDRGEIHGMTMCAVRNNRIIELWTNVGRWWV